MKDKIKTRLIHVLGGVTIEEAEKAKRLDRTAEAFTQRHIKVEPITLRATSNDPHNIVPVESLYHDCAVKILGQTERHINYSDPGPNNTVEAELTILPIRRN